MFRVLEEARKKPVQAAVGSGGAGGPAAKSRSRRKPGFNHQGVVGGGGAGNRKAKRVNSSGVAQVDFPGLSGGGDDSGSGQQRSTTEGSAAAARRPVLALNSSYAEILRKGIAKKK